MKLNVDVVLPCLNEAEALPGVLRALPEGFLPLVVDNGSTDGTEQVALRLGARVVHEQRPGYGAAVHCGLVHARSDIVAVMDADGSLDPTSLPAMTELLVSEDADLVVGRRVPSHRAAQPWHARAGNALLAATLRRRGVPVHDIAPIRVGRRTRLLELGVEDRAFGYPLELLVRAGKAGWRLREVEVDYRPRAGGRSKVSGSVRGTLRAVRDMSTVLVRL
ncbi:glycosyltransferase family 2 protein [Kibdelosporangium phytohabitans]|uniref:Glycosyltransferase n=1 Tax=Kibdelosporangium phytohabitans TaxID=860235 RepID=A0A0N9HWB9_9PSEU|nr:glycosyltransferase family 2 protein [Kibdelosporangium phytohabitans]ALG06290.1 glycosyltransferase [Kibdelosporangium phytohabitans]MBE1467404.1 glycosyltransferase involved in cell wall biosynthesis [Kibdelosporangium phytohabitans]